MTGPEHYREAERHLSAASFLDRPGGAPVNPKASAHHLAAAQVHATLALAASTAEQVAAYSYEHKCAGVAVDEWAEVLAKPGGNAELEQHGTPEEAAR